MPQTCFVVMQIGDAALDHVYEEAIRPAAERAGLEVRRIDLDNEGGLLKSEIVSYLERSEIIVADLTNERPNCYLEIGYAMGLGRHRNLILTVRGDHYPGNPGFSPAGPRVHFDLTGYDILFWSADELQAFARDLEERIRRRLAITSNVPPTGRTGSPQWMDEAHDRAHSALRDRGGLGFMEVSFELDPPKIERSQAALLEAARGAEISTFGWPIGVVMDNAEYRPRPTGDGIRAEIAAERWGGDEQTYDYWELRTNGDFFLLQSLFEDQRGAPDKVFFNTRIVRVTEAVLYAARLYERLDVDGEHVVHMQLRHGGLEGRTLTSASPNRRLSMEYRSSVDEAASSAQFALGAVATDLLAIVQGLVAPLFELFDFFSLGESVYKEVVDNFVAGKVT